LLDTDDDKVTASGLWNDVRSRKMAFLPAVWFLRQLPIRIINVNGYFCLIDLCSQPEPIFVPLKQLLPHCLFFSRTKVASPVVLTHLKSLFYVWFCRLKSKRLCVIHRGASRTLHDDHGCQQRAGAGKNFCETVHRNFLIPRDDAGAEPRRDLVDLLN
jgi:hypothetical protein